MSKFWSELVLFHISTCDFQQCGILTSVDSVEPVQPPVKHRNFKISSLVVIVYLND